MKINKLLLLFLITTLISCKTHHSRTLSVLPALKAQNGLSYNESLSKWTELKAKNGNSYVYQTTFTSWAGFGSITELKVIDGIVTSRNYQYFQINVTNGLEEIVDSYSETKADLGIHEKGAVLMTIDELYNTCASKYLIVEKETNTIYFESKLNGLMTLCGFVPENCADDCYTGIRIDSFDWIK